MEKAARDRLNPGSLFALTASGKITDLTDNEKKRLSPYQLFRLARAGCIKLSLHDQGRLSGRELFALRAARII